RRARGSHAAENRSRHFRSHRRHPEVVPPFGERRPAPAARHRSGTPPQRGIALTEEQQVTHRILAQGAAAAALAGLIVACGGDKSTPTTPTTPAAPPVTQHKPDSAAANSQTEL